MKLLLVVMLGCILCQAQNKGGDFPAIDEYEKRSAVLKIREMLLNETDAKEKRDKTVQQIEASFYTAQRMTDSDAQLTELIRIRHAVQDIFEEVKEATGRQVELAGMIDKAMAAGGLLPQVSAYLGEARTQLRTMGTSQDALAKRMQGLHERVKVAIRNVPPPRIFTSRTGVEFQLIAAGKNSFYVSSKPVSAGNVTLEEAYFYARDFSQREKALYKLPTMAEMKLMNQVGFKPVCAIWSIQPWGVDDPDVVRMSERFGVKMYWIWDPACKLGRQPTFGELKFAKFPSLGYYLVTGAKTGWQNRWDRIIADMAQVK